MNLNQWVTALPSSTIPLPVLGLAHTAKNRALEIFHYIAEACVGLEAQLVIALGGGSPELLQRLPGEP